MPSGTGLNKFKEKFENRFFDVGIAEQHAVTFALDLHPKDTTFCCNIFHFSSKSL